MLIIPIVSFVIMQLDIVDKRAITGKAYWLYSLNSSFMLMIALGLFTVFKKHHFFSRIVNAIASLTFAVYLLHDNSDFRNLIWKNIFSTTRFFSSHVLVVIAHAFLCIIILFIIAMIIEWIRKRLEYQMLKLPIFGKVFDCVNVWGKIWES